MSDTTIRGFNISPQQRHLWMAQSRRDHTDLCSQIAVLVEGEIHPEILKRVLENVCRRHDILRTRFRTLPEISMPLQVICDDVCVLVREDDRRHIPAENVEADFRAVFQKLAAQGCALSDTPSFEVDLLKYSPVKRVLILRMPSLCADLIAMRNIVEQIGEAYFLQGRGESLVQGDPVAFTAIAEWLNDLAHAEEAERGRVHWSKFDFSAWENENPRRKRGRLVLTVLCNSSDPSRCGREARESGRRRKRVAGCDVVVMLGFSARQTRFSGEHGCRIGLRRKKRYRP